MARVAQLEQGGTDEGADKRADDAADEGDWDPDHRADQPSEQGAPAGPCGSAISLRKVKSQPVVDDFSQKRDAEDDCDHDDANRTKPCEPSIDEDSAHHDPQSGKA